MGCCNFELQEVSLYKLVAKVKNQHRTKSSGPMYCHLCQNEVEHAFLKKDFIGFSVKISCRHCGWTFQG